VATLGCTFCDQLLDAPVPTRGREHSLDKHMPVARGKSMGCYRMVVSKDVEVAVDFVQIKGTARRMTGMVPCHP
jgi:hypothetical protein